MNLDGRPASQDVVRRMHGTLVHRGPDDSGDYVVKNTAIGHRRLSIVDLTRGHQPMHLAGTPLHIVYNGEIYNHMDLRNTSDTYHTTCDTETLLVSYRRQGPSCLHSFVGMFAVAILNEDRQSLWLARDRLGVKPLYYFTNDRLFAFASEIKALLAHPEISAQVNTSRLPVQLALKYTLDDQTLFLGIHKLMPGHWMEISGDGVRVHQYWNMRFSPKDRSTTFEAAADEFQSRFQTSVKRCLMADVPLGVFLSGGIDSSVIAASMAEHVGDPIKSFSVGFGERGYSELSYAREVAQHVGAEQREIIISPEQWLHAWPRMVYHEDEPIAHPSSIPLHFVSLLASKEVKVVLTGEGSDELLAGYERYHQTLQNLRWGRWLPDRLRRLTRAMIDNLPDMFLPKRKAVRTSLYLERDIDTLFLDNYSAMTRPIVAAALQPGLAESVDEIYTGFREFMQQCDSSDLLDQILYADMKTYLLELLMKQDQMSMSASIESRVPFLDHELVEFVCQLPTSFKLQGSQTKRILRKALGSTIPQSIVSRPKLGFPTPIKQWFRGPFHQTLQSLLLGSDNLLSTYIRPEITRNLLDLHRNGSWDLHEALWSLGNLEIWLRIFIDGQSPEVLADELCEPLTCSSFG